MHMHAAITVTEASQVGEARRKAIAMAQGAGLDETQAGRVAIIASELATNLSRYAKDGRLLLYARPAGALPALVEIISIDAGPGFDPVSCLADGFSTGGTPGQGLGAVRRLADAFDYYAAPDRGSALVARVFGPAGEAKPPAGIKWACVSLPAPGEIVCGDGWDARLGPEGALSCVVTDGLGHGIGAAQATEAALSHFDSNPFQDGAAWLTACHQRLTSTRGAAVAVAHLYPAKALLRYTGVGNIAGTLVSGTTRRGLVSHNGTVGAAFRKAQTFEYPLQNSNMLVMHSDGLQSRWTLDPYPGLASRDPALVAAILHRDFYRSRDDVTVLVAQLGGRP